MIIWIPKVREVELASKVGVSGEYRMIVRERDGTVARDTGWFPNIITDIGLNAMRTGSTRTTMCIGNGTATPAGSDTTLANYLASSTGSAPGGGLEPASPTVVSPYLTGVLAGYRFPIGSLNSSALSEVGVSSTSNGTALFSRALIVTGGGAPTTIAVSSTQQLDAFYRLNRHPPLADTSNVVTLDGVSRTVPGRAAYVGNTAFWRAETGFNGVGSEATVSNATALGAITGDLAGSTASNSSSTSVVAAYVNNSLQTEVTVNFSTSQGNIAGGATGCLLFFAHGSSASAYFKYLFPAAVTKDATKTMALNFRVSWGRF